MIVRKRGIGLLLLIAALLFITPVCKAQAPIFKNGDQVVFVGNSITNHGGFHHDIALFYATRYPTQNINVINSGISGNRAINVISRMDSDVLNNHPNWSVIKLGMNDVQKDLYTKEAWAKPGIADERKKAADVYRRDYEIIIKTLLKNNSKIILQTPTIYDQTAFIPANEKLIGRNDGLKEYAGYIKEFGKKYNLPVVDYWTIMNEITQKVQATDSTATIIGADRVHPGPVGHFIMAYQFLKTTGVQAGVSNIVLTAGKTIITGSLNVRISNIKNGNKGISFTCLENSLPFPIPQGADWAIKLVPFTDDLNKEMVCVKGLNPGNYQLKIDGQLAGTYTAKELAAGINLALNKNTPQYAQSQKILHYFEDYWKLEAITRYIRGMEMGRLQAKKIYTLPQARQYFEQAVAATKDTTTAAYKDLISFRNTYLPAKAKQAESLAQMKALHDLIYKDNQPVPHHFEIIKN
jgi:hypothetical protein